MLTEKKQSAKRHPRHYGEGNGGAVRKYEPIHPRGTKLRIIPFAAILSVILLATGIVYFVKQSTPFRMCEDFIRGSVELRNIIGDVIECNFQLPLEAETPFGKDMRIRYSFDVKGTKGSTTVSILLKRSGDHWSIISASYRKPNGTFTPLDQGGVK